MKTVATQPPTKKSRAMISADDEAAVTDIRIAPDGRVFVFGTSWPVLEMLNDLGWGDTAITARIQALQQIAADRDSQQTAAEVDSQEPNS